MLDRVKTALVESYVGAIALGFMFAEGIQRVAYTVAGPTTRWLLQWLLQKQGNQYPGNLPAPPRFPFEATLPQFFTALFMLAAAFALLRWLYFPEAASEDQAPEPEESA